MSTENNYKDMLNNLIEPSSGTEDWNVFLDGQQLRQEVCNCLSNSKPGSDKQYDDIVLKFMWEDISVQEARDELNALFFDLPQLKDRFARFLLAPLETSTNQAEAKEQLCKLLGIAGTVRRKPGVPSEADQDAFDDAVKEHFDSVKYDTYLRTGLEVYENPIRTRGKILELLEGDRDLWEQYQILWPE